MLKGDRMNVEFVEGKSVILRVNRGGMFQRIVFKMVGERSPAGKYKLLVTDRQLPVNELQRLADETGLPLRAASMTVFPKGKSSKDFLI